MRGQVTDLCLQGRLELLPGAGNVVGHLVLMCTAAPGQERGGKRDSDRAANVAHQVVDPAGGANLLPGKFPYACVLMGTKINPTPKPVTKIGSNKVQGLISTVTLPMYNVVRAKRIKPNVSKYLASIRS